MSARAPRIALLSPHFPPRLGGGVASSHYNLFRGLRRAGANVEAFLFRDAQSTHPPQPEVHHAGPSARTMDLLPRAFRLALRVAGEQGQADQFSESIPNAFALRAVRRQLDHFSPQVVILPDRGGMGAFLPKRRMERWLLVMHHHSARFGKEPLLGTCAPTDQRLAVWLDQRALQQADAVVCPSQHMLDSLRETQDPRAPLHQIPNGVDLALLDGVNGGTAPQPTVYLPALGTMAKGRPLAGELIRRIAERSGSTTRFYISGPTDPALRRELALAGLLDRCELPGARPYVEHIARVKTCCLCVTPSLIENFSMTVLEAMACWLPVVAFATGGIPEAVQHGRTGCIVPYMDIQNLAAEAVSLLHDEARRATWGAQARTRVQEFFSVDVITTQYLALCQELAARAGS